MSEDNTGITIEQIEHLLDKRGFVTHQDLEIYARTDSVIEVGRAVSAVVERTKNTEHRIEKLETIPVIIEEIKGQYGRIFDLAQNTNNMMTENARATQRERERIDGLDKRVDSHQETTNKRFESMTDKLNDISERSILTVENSKKTQLEMNNVMKSLQDMQSMMSQFLMHQAQVQTALELKDATREELFTWVATRKRFEENAGKRIKAILEVLFKDRLRTAGTLVIASVPILKPVVEMLQSILGG